MALRVIGAGLGRTGTDSLRQALTMLGFAPCHHMFELRDNPDLVPPWLALLREEAPADWDALFAGYAAQVDWPGAAFWRETAAHFPKAKVILTTRDAEGWYRSLSKTILPFVAAKGRHRPPHRNDIAEITDRIFARQIGDARDPEVAIAAFHAHEAAVRAAIPAERLLVYPVGAGWAPLCAFLGVPVPTDPFPSGNSTAAFRARMAAHMEKD